MAGRSTLIIGGARSGKSSFAQELARRSLQPVLFVATAEAGDDEMSQRIEAHKEARPDTWRTLEAPTRVGDNIRREIGSTPTVVVDCITLLINNVLMKYTGTDGELGQPQLAEEKVTAELDSLVECVRNTGAGFIIVTNEVGQGLVPASRLGRLYRDLLGKANQVLAQHVDEVYLMVVGLPVKVK